MDLFDTWSQIAHEYELLGGILQYQREIGAAKPLLHEFLHPELKTLPPAI